MTLEHIENFTRIQWKCKEKKPIVRYDISPYFPNRSQLRLPDLQQKTQLNNLPTVNLH